MDDTQQVYVLELDGSKAIHFHIDDLTEALKLEFYNLHSDDFESTNFKVYTMHMSNKDIDNLPEFEGF